MSIKGCFRAKVAVGRVDGEAGANLLRWIDEAEADRAGRLSARDAAREAAIEVADAASRQAARDADLRLRTIEAQLDVLERVSEVRGRLEELTAQGSAPRRLGLTGLQTVGPELSTGVAVRSMLARDPFEVATGPSVHYLARDIRGRAHAGFADAIERLRPKLLGLKRESAAELDTIRALYGESAAPDAVASARAFAEVAEDLRRQFNEAGGDIPARTNWRLPQPHDATKVAAVTRDGWIADVLPLLDRADMLDVRTGRPLSDARLREVLAQVYDSIASRGVTGPPTAGGAGRPMLANERAAARVLSFRDADSWMAYRAKYGTAEGPFEVMMGHLADMADDIAQLRVLGPNPAGMRRFVESLFAREQAALRGGADPADAGAVVGAVRSVREGADRLLGEKARTLALWDEVTGAASVPGSMVWAERLGAVRALLSAAQLGSAVISSISDTANTAMTALFNGIPMTRVMTRAVAALADGRSEIQAARLGLVADSLAQSGRELDRYMGETIAAGRASRISGAVIRASGLRKWTAALKTAFYQEFMGAATDAAPRRFGELDPRFRESLGRYGIDAEAWDLIRSATPFEPRPGATFIRPEDVAALPAPGAREAAERYGRMLNTELDYAVIDNDPVTRALLFGGTRPGTPSGELTRTFMQYKAFPVSIIMLHGARALARGWDGSRLGHAAILFTTLTVLGTLAMQVKQIANGKDPRSLDPSTREGLYGWGAGLLQGGGLGLFGDLLGQDANRYGASFLKTLAGPTVGLVDDVALKWAKSNVESWLEGKPTHFAGDGLYVLSRYLPGTSLWYGRLALQRKVFDQLALMVDERTPERHARMRQAAEKDWRQKFWWTPGRSEPSRAPALDAVTGR